MTDRRSLWAPMAGAFILSLALAGCGGGGGGTAGTGGGSGNTVRLATVPAVYASSSSDTLRARLAIPNAKLPTSSTAIVRNYSTNTVGKLAEKDFYMKSISGDGDDGLHIVYVVDGIEKNIHLSQSENYTNGDLVTTIDGKKYWFWDFTNTSTVHRGGRNYDYADANGYEVSFLNPQGRAVKTYRGMVGYGLQTRPENLPKGSATYIGDWFVEGWDDGDPDLSTGKEDARGNLRLQADFDRAVVTGRVENFEVRESRSSDYDNMRPGNSVVIWGGRISGNKITASWRGEDTNPADDENYSVRGFSGTMNGRFFGPAAEEAGGLIDGEHAEYGVQVIGVFGAKKVMQ